MRSFFSYTYIVAIYFSEEKNVFVYSHGTKSSSECINVVSDIFWQNEFLMNVSFLKSPNPFSFRNIKKKTV